MRSTDWGASVGDDNTCDTYASQQWSDTGTTGCTYVCPYCSSCGDCENKMASTKLEGDTVYLISDITNNVGTCINDPENFTGRTLDCMGHIIDGDDSGTDYGIYLEEQDNNILKNCTITDFNEALKLYESDNNQIIDFSVTSNLVSGFSVKCDNNSIVNSTVRCSGGSGIGINVSGNASNFRVENTNISNCDIGLLFETETSGGYAYDNYICGNTLDIQDDDATTGDLNLCDTATGYSDLGSSGCYYNCTEYAQGYRYCDNCTDCEEKLNDTDSVIVRLRFNITGASGTCINDPDNFQDKTFDCQGRFIEGSGSGMGIHLANKYPNRRRAAGYLIT